MKESGRSIEVIFLIKCCWGPLTLYFPSILMENFSFSLYQMIWGLFQQITEDASAGMKQALLTKWFKSASSDFLIPHCHDTTFSFILKHVEHATYLQVVILDMVVDSKHLSHTQKKGGMLKFKALPLSLFYSRSKSVPEGWLNNASRERQVTWNALLRFSRVGRLGERLPTEDPEVWRWISLSTDRGTNLPLASTAVTATRHWLSHRRIQLAAWAVSLYLELKH